jgi:polyhydroxybutyrate depolymerase
MRQVLQGNKRRLFGIGCVGLGVILAFSLLIYIYISYNGPALSISGVLARQNPTPTLPPITCKTPRHTTGDATVTIPSAGLQRTLLIHLAPSYGRQAQPLVILYHGYSMTVQAMERTSGMDVEADKAGFVVVYPQGVDSPPSWNAGVGAYGPTGDANDIQFTRDMLTYLEKNYCVDTHRVYLSGFSLGGGMAYRLACTLTDQIAAVATVSGAYYPLPEGCHPSRPLPVMEIHGAADPSAPYDGNPDLRIAAVQDYLHGWTARDQCTGNPTTFFQKEDVTGIEWTHCADGTIVRHYRISDGVHSWPGSPHTTNIINGDVVIWTFFSQFSLK